MAGNNPKRIPQLSQKDIESFWSKVDKRPGQGPNGDCHEWQAGCFNSGYGAFSPHFGMIFRAHRVAYFLATGDDPGSLLVLHACDNPPCCNAVHLWKDTNKANVKDMMQKARARPASGSRHGMRTHPERAAKGERNGRAKLTDDDVREIRRKYATGKYTLFDLAKEYPLRFASFSDIINRKKWRHIE